MLKHKLYIILLLPLLLCFCFVGNVGAVTNPDGCNSGDIVRIRFARNDKPDDIHEYSVKVNNEALVGGNYLIKVTCHDDRYTFSTIRLKDSDGDPNNQGTINSPKLAANQMSEDGTYMFSDMTASTTSARLAGIDYTFWMASVEQKDDTADPETGISENEYNPAISDEDNSNDGNMQVVDDELDTTPDTCRNSQGAQSLGWIVCPLLDWMGNAADSLYNNFIAPKLRVDPGLFNASGGTNIVNAWNTFRDIANVLFVILLLFVIFSQLTGIGIDNYGIKKILPKLIVAAIMINLSYVLCMILVDLSNILGNGLQAMFDALGENLEPVVDFEADGGSNAGAVSGTLASVGVLVAAVGMFGSIWANPAILLSLLTGALSVVITIFFLFVLLAAREAAIIVLVAISPLAVVAYMLPNTKALFDRWWKFFQGLLLVYPIAGLMVGGGNYVSRLLLDSSTGFYTGLTAMVVGIVPIFFIPMVLRGSFAAMGRVGGMLTGLGDAVRGRATGAVRGSERFQNAQKNGLERRARLAVRRRAGGYIGEDGQFHERGLRSRLARTGFGQLTGMDARMGQARSDYVQAQNARANAVAGMDTDLMNAQLQQAENTRAQNAAEAAVGVPALSPDLARSRAESRLSAQELKAYQDQFAGFSQAQLRSEAAGAGSWLNSPDGSQRMSALLQAMEQNGMEKDIASMLRNNNVSNMSGVMQTLAGSKNAVFSAYGKRGNDGTNAVSFDQFMSGDANDRQSMASYLKEKGGDAVARLDDKSLATISNYQEIIDNAAAASGTTANQIMSTDQLVDAASQMKGEDSLAEINKMLQNRSDIRMSGNQLANMSNSTIRTMSSNASGRNAILSASDDVARDPKLINRMAVSVRNEVNSVRASSNLQNPNGPTRQML